MTIRSLSDAAIQCLGVYRTQPIKVIMFRDNGYRYVNVRDLICVMDDSCIFDMSMSTLYLYDLIGNYHYSRKLYELDFNDPDMYEYIYVAVTNRGNMLKDKKLLRWIKKICNAKEPRSHIDMLCSKMDRMTLDSDDSDGSDGMSDD